MSEGDIGKLRSVARIAKEGNQTIVFKNNFTSLVKLPEWSSDAQSYLKKQNLVQDEDDNIYTHLNDLATKSASKFIFIQSNSKEKYSTSSVKSTESAKLHSNQPFNSTNKEKTFSMITTKKGSLQSTECNFFVAIVPSLKRKQSTCMCFHSMDNAAILFLKWILPMITAICPLETKRKNFSD